MQAALEPIRSEMRKQYAAAARQPTADAVRKELAKFDLKAMAKTSGLTMARLEMIAVGDAQSTELGESTLNGEQPFVQYMFVPGLGRAAISEDAHGNKYVAWKVDEQLEHVPNLTDKGVRDRVVLAWKKSQARVLALAEAQKLAAKANAEKKPLKEVLKGIPGVTVSEPPPFTWVTFGAVPRYAAQVPPRIGEVRGVDMPGNDFMAAVFALQPEQTGVAMNYPRNTAYVIRLDKYLPTDVVLWARFLSDDYGKYQAVGDDDRANMISGWISDIRAQAGFHWERQPDQHRDEGRIPGAPRGRQPAPGEDDLD
jgi:hypothetical protein